jgi:NADPH-dependent 2,4-dienoyl-CoA reductase/sulfur reductase-like enzyme/nitrite reductase/ring-hydroxylating ferredoxin subunit
MAASGAVAGPDLEAGVKLADIPADGVLVGHVGETQVLLARVDGKVRAFNASCTHYGGPLGEGVRVGDTIGCPWHHACFSLKTGEAQGAPAFFPLDRWKVELKWGKAVVKKREKPRKPKPAKLGAKPPERVIIIGGGAAGFACAERLRGLGWKGELTLLSDDQDLPVDRPNLSKDYLAGSAPEEWMPLRDEAFYREQEIDLRLAQTVAAVDPGVRKVMLEDGQSLPYDALLIATGAEPVRLDGLKDAKDVFTLRSFADCRAIIARAARARAAIVVGAGFIGMEAAASLNARGLDVHVVAPEQVPMERQLGPELGRFLAGLHRANGVELHLGRTVASFEGGRARLDDGSEIAGDFLLVGVGVRPRVELARRAGLRVDHGVKVDGRMRTSAPGSSALGIWAAGDIAEYPDPRTGEAVRIEHWVVAERQGQVAAEDMLGVKTAYEDAPFFWTHQFGAELRVSGLAGHFDEVEVDGSIEDRDCEVRYLKGGRLTAVATLGRDKANLEQAVAWEREAAR